MKIIINQYSPSDSKNIQRVTGMVPDKFKTLPAQRLDLINRAVNAKIARIANEYVDFGTHKAWAKVVTFNVI